MADVVILAPLRLLRCHFEVEFGGDEGVLIFWYR